MASCKVTARVLRDAHVSLELNQAVLKAGWKYDDYRRHEPWRTHMISFTSVLYHPGDGKVYCGLTSFSGKIFYRFDPETKKFEDLHFERIGDIYDAKIHRSLELDDDGTIVGATAYLIDFADHPDAPGGKVFRYDPKTDELKVIDVPVPHDGIQSIALDRRRQIVYGNCYPLGHKFQFDLRTKETKPFKWINAHKVRCDDEGSFWGLTDPDEDGAPWPYITDEQAKIMETLWNIRSKLPKLYKYNPEEGFVVFTQGFPPFSGKPQSIANMVDGDDGYVYFGTNFGALYRADKRTGELEYSGLPNVGGRLEGMAFGKDGLLYLGGGSFYQTRLSVYDRESGKFTDLGPIYDPEKGKICIIVHDLTVTDDGVVYVGETDNAERSGYLWECEVKL